MGFNRFTKNVLNISGLPDRVQNQATTLKALFDQAGVDIKEALNALMAQLEASTAADSIGADVASVTTKTVQAILTAYEQEISDRYTKLESDTMLSENTNSLVQDVDINLTTGMITVTKKDGTVETFDTAIEKVPAKFEIVETNGKYALKITNVDGTSTQTDITNLMNIYNFNNSDTINFAVTGEGNEKTVVANIKANSIGLDKLSLTVVSTLEGYMNSAKDSANAAKISENNAKSAANTATKAAETASAGAEAGRVAVQKATEAESYAHGGTGTRQGEDTDNAKYYAQIAKEAAGGDFVTPVEMEAYAQPLGTTPTYETTELSGQEIEVDAPLAIESILQLSGNSEQDSRSGKNLLKPIDSKTINGVTLTNNSDGTFDLSGTASGDAYFVFATTDILVSGSTYTLSKNISDFGISIYEYNGNTWLQTVASMSKTELSKTFTYAKHSSATRSALQLNITSGMTLSLKNIKLQLELGSTATEYEAYGVQPSPDYPSEIRSVSGDVEVKAEGKNLYDYKDRIQSISGLTNVINADGTVTTTGTPTASYASIIPGLNITDLLEDGEIYTVAQSTAVTQDIYIQISLKRADNGVIEYINTKKTKGKSATFVVDKTTYQRYDINVQIGADVTTNRNFTSGYMLLKGSYTDDTLPDFEPYKTKTIPIPLGDIVLRSTPDETRDTFERVDGVWKKRNNVDEEVLNGTQEISTLDTDTSGYTRFGIVVDNVSRVDGNNTVPNTIICNKLIPRSLSGTWYLKEGISLGVKGSTYYKAFTIYMDRTKTMTLAEFKTYLSNNPITVQYKLATPTYTPITDQALISALDELEQLVLHKGYNRITATAVNGVKAYLDLSIPSTASVTNVVETEANLDMPVLLAPGTGDVKAKVTDKVTVNPATGEVKTNGEKVATIKTLLSTIPDTGWTATSPYTVNVTIPDMLNTDIPHITPVYTGVIATDKAIQEAWSNVDRAVANNGSLQVIAFEEVPTIGIPIQIEVIR